MVTNFNTDNSAILSDTIMSRIGTNKASEIIVAKTPMGLSVINTFKNDTITNIPKSFFGGNLNVHTAVNISPKNEIWGSISFQEGFTTNRGLFHIDTDNTLTIYDSTDSPQMKKGIVDFLFRDEQICMAVGAGILVMDFNTSIAEPSNQTLKAHVFPNPASAVLNVAINTQIFDPTTIKLYNHVGNLVYQETTKQQLFALPINQLKQGVYVINITAKNLTPYRQKVLILNP
jgi:hypothetical protein